MASRESNEQRHAEPTGIGSLTRGTSSGRFSGAGSVIDTSQPVNKLPAGWPEGGEGGRGRVVTDEEQANGAGGGGGDTRRTHLLRELPHKQSGGCS